MRKVYKKSLSGKIVPSGGFTGRVITRLVKKHWIILGLAIGATVVSSGTSAIIPGLKGFALGAIVGFIAFFLGFYVIEKTIMIRDFK